MEANSIETKPWYKKWWGMAVLAFVFLFLIVFIAFVFAVFNAMKSGKNNLAGNTIKLNNIELSDVERAKIEGTGSYSMGTDKPKITIVEFSDFACPYCKNSFYKIREISLKYIHDIKYIYRDMPLHEESAGLALAARCAGEQGLFWQMHDRLFQDQGVKSEEDLSGLAVQIGADTTKFEECFKSKKYLPQIQKDYLDGQDLEVVGTPVWFINGNKLSGDLPIEMWEEIIGQFIATDK